MWKGDRGWRDKARGAGAVDGVVGAGVSVVGILRVVEYCNVIAWREGLASGGHSPVFGGKSHVVEFVFGGVNRE